eukprot:c19990_g1_i2.p1 GENE.c19990_g1_i2~~c19990_g1_i2.p1  ORF type:complete len:130 (+),score=25.20 c19990_g1_i2:319-708(+)
MSCVVDSIFSPSFVFNFYRISFFFCLFVRYFFCWLVIIDMSEYVPSCSQYESQHGFPFSVAVERAKANKLFQNVRIGLLLEDGNAAEMKSIVEYFPPIFAAIVLVDTRLASWQARNLFGCFVSFSMTGC